MPEAADKTKGTDTAQAQSPEPTKEQPKKEKASAPTVPTFTHDQFIDRLYRLTGYPARTVAGALRKVEKKNLTVAEVKKACEDYLNKKVSA